MAQEQAAQFAAWLSIKKESNEEVIAVVNYVNSSNLPVYNFLATPGIAPNRHYWLRIIEPTKEVSSIHLNSLSDWLTEKVKEESLAYPQEEKHAARTFVAMLATQEGLKVSFSDVQNNRWVREADGKLRRDTDEPDTIDWSKVPQLGNGDDTREPVVELLRILDDKEPRL